MTLVGSQKILWEKGNLVCIKKATGKCKIRVKTNRATALKNSSNRWLFKQEFDTISEPDDKLHCIADGRVLDIPAGKYLSSEHIKVKENLGFGDFQYERAGFVGIFNIRTGEFANIFPIA